MTTCSEVLRLLSLSLLVASTARAAPELAFGLGPGLLPARHEASRLDVTVLDQTGTRWDWSDQRAASVVGPGLVVRAEVRWSAFSIGLDAALSFASFATEQGKTGKTYGATLSLPFGLRTRHGPLEFVALAGPALVLGGYGFGTFARQGGQPIDFGEVQFFDDETALHLIDTSVGVMAGLEVRGRLTDTLSLFVQVTGFSMFASSRTFNVAGFVDEAQSKVEWSRRSLNDPAVSVRFDGRRFDATTTVFGFDGPRVVIGLDVRAF